MRGRLRPSKQQHLLLECAFGEADRAAAAWREARPRLDLDRLDTGSHALMPLVFRRLATELESDPDAARIKGIFRKTWYANGLLLAAAAEALNAFADAGVRALALHGVVLADRYYAEPALRPLTHVDVAVKSGDAMRACYALGKTGWVGQRPDLVPADVGVVFRNARGSLLALHRALPENLRVPGDQDADDIWAEVRSATVADAPAHVLSPADELLCAIVAGPDATLLPNVQWVADAATIVRVARGELDWVAFAARARTYRVVPHVAAAVSLLRSIGVGIPDVALAEPARRDRIAYRLYARPDGVAGGLPRTLGRHVRESDAGAIGTVATLPRFLKRSWGVASGRELVGLALAKARRRLSARSAQVV